MAPGAKIISLKVAAADGATDVSQVIAAIDWVVAHRNDPGLNIRVLNLSFGTDSTQTRGLDPLSYAVEQAWSKGIVVVVAAGNDGFAANRLTMPAANPYVIAVGAADAKGTEIRADDVVADFSNRGNAARHADLLAAGRSVVSLRDPGSYIDTTYPDRPARHRADPAQRFFRGSGTSQAAAVVSGAGGAAAAAAPDPHPGPGQAAADEHRRPDRRTATRTRPAPARSTSSRRRRDQDARRSPAQPTCTSTGLGTLERRAAARTSPTPPPAPC